MMDQAALSDLVSELRERVGSLEKAFATLDHRTVGLVKLGPGPFSDETEEQRADNLKGLKKIISHLTTDPHDPALGHGSDDKQVAMNAKYLVLSDEELAKGFVRPFRNKYIHKTCGVETVMGEKLSATYARDPKFYGATYCVHCGMHRPVSEFTWSADGLVVGS